MEYTICMTIELRRVMAALSAKQASKQEFL